MKLSDWKNLYFNEEVTAGFKKGDNVQKMFSNVGVKTCGNPIRTPKNAMDRTMFKNMYQKITSRISTKIEVTYKVYRKRIGFGFITEGDTFFKSKAVSVNRSPFFNQEQVQLLLISEEGPRRDTKYVSSCYSYFSKYLYHPWPSTTCTARCTTSGRQNRPGSTARLSSSSGQ